MITVDQRDLLRALTMSLACAHKDPTRTSCYQVRLEPMAKGAQQGVRIIATDGHMMSVWEAPAVWTDETAFNVRRDIVEALYKAVKAQKVGTVDIDPGSARGVGWSLALNDTGEKFPPYQQVVPQYTGEETLGNHIGMNGRILARLGKAFDECDNRSKKASENGSAPMRFQFSGVLDPMLVTCETVPEVTVVLMPCRVTEVYRPRKAA